MTASRLARDAASRTREIISGVDRIDAAATARVSAEVLRLRHELVAMVARRHAIASLHDVNMLGHEIRAAVKQAGRKIASTLRAALLEAARAGALTVDGVFARAVAIAQRRSGRAGRARARAHEDDESDLPPVGVFLPNDGSDLFPSVSIEGAVPDIPPELFDALASLSEDEVTSLSDGLGSEILKAIRRAAIGTDGMTPADAMRIIDDMLPEEERGASLAGGAYGSSAERIVRTQLARAFNAVAAARVRDLAKRSGANPKRQWLATLDSRTRPAHLEAHGQVVGVDEPFVVDDEELDYPGDPSGSPENVINCRCVAVPVVPDDPEDLFADSGGSVEDAATEAMRLPYVEQLQDPGGGLEAWRVDGKWIRDRVDVEFVNAGQHYEFPLVPENELWIDAALERDEIPFLVHHLLVERRLMKAGAAYDEALAAADRAERAERAKADGATYRKGRAKAGDPVEIRQLGTVDHGRVRVVEVDGRRVRDSWDVDFTEGANDLARAYCPEATIWIEAGHPDRDAILVHESVEREEMKRGKSYAEAHEEASRRELEARSDPHRVEPLLDPYPDQGSPLQRPALHVAVNPRK